MTEVTPGIHWLKLPIKIAEFTPTHVNAYLIQGDSGYLLVDAGWNTDDTFDSLKQQMAEIGAGIKDISRILVTHVHPDHYGMAGRVKRLSGAILVTHDIEKGFIALRYINPNILIEQTSQWLAVNGTPPDELSLIRDSTLGMEQFVDPASPDTTLHGGETMATGTFTFRVMWTPGHSSGHICLYEPEKKILVSGDCILPKITPHIGLHPQSVGNPLGNYLNTLNELKKLDAKIILPGHESPFTNLKKRVNEIIHHHEHRNQEILATLKGKPKTAYQVARDTTWSITASWQDMPLFHKRLAISEALSHLEHMAINNQIAKLSRDSIIYYRQT